MKTTLHIISILACLSLAAFGAKGQVKEVQNVPTKGLPCIDSVTAIITDKKADSIKYPLIIRCYRCDATVYIIDGVKVDTGKVNREERGCYPQYIIDGTKVESKDLPTLVHEDFSAHCVLAKNQDPFTMVDNHDFIMTSGADYSRWEIKEFGPWHFPGI